MQKHRSTLARNATYLTIASILQKAITFGYYGFLASSIGAGNIGKYTFALTVSSVCIIFMDFGLGSLLTREVAKNPSSLQETFNRFLSTKILLIIASAIIYIATIHIGAFFFQSIDGLDIQLLYIAGCIIIFDTLSFTAFSVLRSLQILQWEAIALVLYQVSIVVSGVIAIQQGFPLTVILSALLVGSFVQFLFIWFAMKRTAHIHFSFRLERSGIKKLLRIAAPFAFAGIIFKLTGSVDSIMLKLAVSDEAAGWYGLAFKLTFALMVIPGSFATSYYPAISDYVKHAPEKVGMLFEQSLLYMLIASFPIMGGVIILGDNIIHTFWEEFSPSIIPLILFMVSLPFLFINYPIGNLLNAANKQKRNTINMFIALVVNIVLNAILIPFYTVIGSAVAALVSAVVLVLLGLPLAYRIAHFTITPLLIKTALLSIATACMMLAVFVVQSHVSIVIAIAVGALTYTAALFLFRVLSLNDLRSMIQSISKQK